METRVTWQQKEGIAIIMFNRPEAYNSFNVDMVKSLAQILVKLALDPGVVGVILSGEGKAFCAGGDLAYIKGSGNTYGAALHELAAHFHQAILEIRHMPKPVVGAINGLAAGGGLSMALSCDFRIMEASATLIQGYTTNGLSIDGGGTFTLPRLVGLARALEIAAFDEPINAEKACAWGMVTKVVEDGTGVKSAIQLIEEMKKRSFTSFAASKKLLTGSFDTPLEVQLEKERELLAWCGDQPNGREGIGAFLEKRKPLFNRA